ncbi:MAG: reverse transcriptase family protein [Deltaproteobacteria bacterium]|nr:reverse transcriptase family protein [Deltaproteobacteria bacterium]
MSDRRQALYDRIRASSKDEVILEEMIRFGFWPAAGLPGDPAEEVRRQGELQQRLTALRAERDKLANVNELRREARKQRLRASKDKRRETKARRLRERAARAAAWRARQALELTFLGAEVSGGMQDTTCDRARLAAQGLPAFATAAEVAQAMGITVGELRFLAFARRASRISHYRRFTMPKKSGGVRAISAPMPRLKRAQHWLLAQILAKVPTHDAAHGFCAGRSIVTNARPHVGAAVVVNLDLQDFFPTVELPRVKGLFRALGYGEQVATAFALLATEPVTEAVELDGQVWHVAASAAARRLPQGSPASPAITNLLCRRLDRRLRGAATALGFTYTRYADDLTFSATAPAAVERAGKLLTQVRWLVGQEGFVVHPDKTRVLRRGRRQEVTGLVVNERLGVPRDQLRRFRALLHHLDRRGLEGARWGASGDVLTSAAGFASYVAMIDPVRGAPLVAEVARLAARLAPAR